MRSKVGNKYQCNLGHTNRVKQEWVDKVYFPSPENCALMGHYAASSGNLKDTGPGRKFQSFSSKS